jgi:hypothetical protein
VPAALLGQKNADVAVTSTDESVEFITGYLVLVTDEGHYMFEPDINRPVTIKRQPTSSEVKGSLSAILMDIAAQETAVMSAQATVNAQMQMARQAYEQQQNAQLIQQLGNK